MVYLISLVIDWIASQNSLVKCQEGGGGDGVVSKVLAIKPGDMSLILRTQMVDKENKLLQMVL